MIKLFVGGFPLEMTELELVQIISLHGEVSTIKIVRDKKTGTCKGYAFVEMKDLAAAENTMDALNGAAIGDRVLTVNITVEKPVAPPRPASSGYFKNPKPANFFKNTGSTDATRQKRPRKQF